MKTKEIKDYLPFYLGCEMKLFKREADRQTYTLDAESLIFAIEDKDKPILRPLSDMTEEEYSEILKICYVSVYDHDPDFVSVEIIPDSSGGGIQAKEIGWQYGLTITNEKVDFSANGSFLNVPQFEIFKLLLSKHFDLFGLIESGLAIDKTTFK